jgi:superfamily II DNA or RNA helicase
MEMNDIRAFINNDVIFRRGMDYYRRACVFRYSRSKGLIEASVVGSARRPYLVQIKLDARGNPKTSFCNCPYSGGGVINCKHIAAVLIHDYEENRPIENPITQQYEEHEVVIDVRRSGRAESDGFDFVRYLLRATGLRGESKGGGKFRLTFVIDFSSEFSARRWVVYPAARYVKANGEGGRFKRYSEERITEPFGKLEKILLYNLLAKRDLKDELLHHVDFFVNNPVPFLFVKYKFRYEPASFIEVRFTHVHFVVDAIRNDKVYFTPEIEFIGDEDHYVMGKEKRFQFVRSGFSFLIIADGGKIFFSRDNERAVDLLDLLLYKKSHYTYADIKRLRGFFPGKGSGIRIENVPGKLRIKNCVPKPFIEIEEKYGYVYIELCFSYGGVDIHRDLKDDFIPVVVDGGPITLLRRNYDFERKLNEFLKIKFKSILLRNFFYDELRVRTSQIEFLVKHGRKFLEEGIEIRLKGKKYRVSSPGGSIALRVNPELDWFEVKAGYRHTEGRLTDIEVDPSLLSGGLIKAGDEYVIITEKDIKKLRALLEEGMSKAGELKIPRLRFYFIDEYYRDIVNRQDQGIRRMREICAGLKNSKHIKEYELPQNFRGNLREYQYAGYRWLFFLYDCRLGGCLADDMGLGKTVQTLAFLQRLKEEGKLGTSLVVVPVNTIANWESEIRRFAPELRYLLHYGHGREKEIGDIQGYDFILSSYHTLRNDINQLKDVHFDYVILDESQSIKNSNSLLFKSVRVLKSDHRLSLTGTPIENSIFELWSQMEFLNPGLLGGRSEFSRKYAKPIEKYADEKATERLRKITYPFILRRKKEDVLKELPDKSEIVLYSHMEQKQASIYDQHRLFFREAIGRKIERDGIKKSAVEIFSALLKLRQIALFPVLADGKFMNVKSCKFLQMKEVVEEILQESHKVAIFSQFVKCLDIIKGVFEAKGMTYTYIDGSLNATQRKEEIKRFQEDEGIRVFLLSLRAGGVGINLTSADYVILYDPWWNPAVESQAVDRLHRIGQTKKVIAYKLIVKNTVEEKMLELQERKKKLVNELITTEKGFFKSLTGQEILGLFSAD